LAPPKPETNVTSLNTTPKAVARQKLVGIMVYAVTLDAGELATAVTKRS
jgi:hypothetical protein